MKRRLVQFCAAAALVIAVSCNNEKTETKTVTPETAKPAADAPVKVEPKTEISVNPNGAEVETKKVNVKIDTKDTLKK